MGRELNFGALECLLDENLPELRRVEWSMGNGQCPECGGAPECWRGHPSYRSMDLIGHAPKCPMARAIRKLGGEPLMIPTRDALPQGEK